MGTTIIVSIIVGCQVKVFSKCDHVTTLLIVESYHNHCKAIAISDYMQEV